jgi:hypothetical protein
VLQELRGEGFEPFMVCQTWIRADDRRDYTKHMICLRHASQINGREANEIILPGTSALTLDNLAGTDPAGYAGLEDGVDWHWDRIIVVGRDSL